MDSLIRDTICLLSMRRRERWFTLLQIGTSHNFESWCKDQVETKLIARLHEALDTL